MWYRLKQKINFFIWRKFRRLLPLTKRGVTIKVTEKLVSSLKNGNFDTATLVWALLREDAERHVPKKHHSHIWVMVETWDYALQNGLAWFWAETKPRNAISKLF